MRPLAVVRDRPLGSQAGCHRTPSQSENPGFLVSPRMRLLNDASWVHDRGEDPCDNATTVTAVNGNDGKPEPTEILRLPGDGVITRQLEVSHKCGEQALRDN